MGTAIKTIRIWAGLFLCIFWLSGCVETDNTHYPPPDTCPANPASVQKTDAITSATPGVPTSILTDIHSGWKNPDCTSCHADVHNGGFAIPECVPCHGVNGAPQRPAGHENSQCTSCHPDIHSSLAFNDPDDCTTCHKYVSGAGCPFTEDYDVVVIGAGGGGLAAAAALAQAGMKVIVIEKQHKVGGYMTSFHRGGYTFEASLHAMDGLHDPDGLNVDMFKRLGIWDKVKPVRPEPMYRAVYPDTTIDAPSDPEQYRKLLKARFPHEAQGIDRLFDDLSAIDRVTPALLKLKTTFSLEALSTVIKNPVAVAQFFLYKRMTLSKMLSRYIHDQKLITVWTALVCFAGAEPDRLSALFFLLMWNSYHLHGYYYFEGGSQSVSDALAEVIGEHGGTIKLNTLVTRVIIENGKAVEVRTADDACYTCRFVLSNANAPDTLLKLVGREYLPEYYVKKIENLQTAVSAFVVYLGVDYDYRSYFKGAHEIFKNESYDQHENFRYIREGIPEKAGFSITDYSVLDPSAAPAGKNVITITSQLPYDWQECWSWNKDHSAYKAFKDEVARIFIKRAEEILPDLSQHIEIMEVGTPLTMKEFTMNPMGSILGWENTPEQSMDIRLPQQTPIDNLLLAGAWTFPGGGQSAVMISGTTAADAILKKDRKR